MKRFTILTLILLSVRILTAQENISVSLRADNNQPFTAKISGKQINSSLSGFLQIADLNDGMHEITITFPENRFPEQQLRFSVSKSDTVFYLKRSGDQSWVIQNANSLLPSGAGSSADTYGKRKSDPFAVLMAAVVNDSSVLYTSLVKSESAPRKTESTPVVAKTSSPVVTNNPAPEKSAAVNPVSESEDSSVVKLEEKKSAAPTKELPPVIDANTTIVKDEDKSLAASTKSKEVAKAATDSVNKKEDSSIAKTESPKPEQKKEVVESNVSKPDSSLTKAPIKDSAARKSEADLAIAPVTDAKKVPDSVITTTTEKPATNKVDSNVANVNIQKPEEKKVSDEKSSGSRVETPPAKKDATAKTESPKPPVLDNTTRIFQLGVAKASERKDDQALHLIYIDRASPDKADTILITIPVDPAEEYKPNEPLFRPSGSAKPEAKKSDVPTKKGSEKQSVFPNKKSSSASTPTVTKAKVEEPVIKSSTQTAEPAATDTGRQASEPLFRPIQRPAESTSLKVDTSKKEYNAGSAWRPLEKKTTAMVNSDCQNFATEYDLDRLRVKMLADNTPDDRISTARKVFKTKCFTSKQIRALSELFTNDEGKYKFLDAAYPFVSDSDSFKQLSELLKDQYYINRFNAMLRN